MTYRHARSCHPALLAVLSCCTPGTPADDTTGGTTAASGSSETSSTGDGTTATPTTTSATTSIDDTSGSSSSTGDIPDPPPVCNDSACSIECSQQQQFTLRDGSACVCQKGVPPAEDEFLGCSLPAVCANPMSPKFMCVIQALRYGVVGSVGWTTQQEDVGGESTSIEILGPGLAQAIERGFVERACCDTISKDHDRYVHPFTLGPPDDPEWQACLDEIQYGVTLTDQPKLPACLRHTNLAVDCSGEPLSECPTPPEPPGPDAACESTCPMMNDGVCDEAPGTGLCRDGCDPVDCACAEDVVNQCDDVSNGGPCPLGSDPDCEFF